MVRDSSSSYKIDYVVQGLILPVGGVASGRVCGQPAEQACFDEDNYLRLFIKHCLILLNCLNIMLMF